MKTFEILENLVKDSEINKMQKSVTLGLIDRMQKVEDKRIEAREFIEAIGVKNISEIIMYNEDVIFYTVFGKPNDEDWDNKYPYRSVVKNKKGLWEKTSTVSPSLDLAYICYLEQKYLCSNSRFSDFAIKMLEIKLED